MDCTKAATARPIDALDAEVQDRQRGVRRHVEESETANWLHTICG